MNIVAVQKVALIFETRQSAGIIDPGEAHASILGIIGSSTHAGLVRPFLFKDQERK